MICGSDFRAAEMRLASILPRGLAAGCFIALLVAMPRLFSVVAIGHFFHAENLQETAVGQVGQPVLVHLVIGILLVVDI